jgi:tetratricopeptide (TPR) repeat protein/glutathione synthase/RimK-type ligase-like ATP-grasp enzyme
LQSFRQPQRKFVPANQTPARRRAAAPSSVFDPALRCLQAGDVAGAVSRLLACRQHVRRSEIASSLLANLLLRLSRAGDAVEWFDAALKLRADYPEALAAKGLALQALDRPGEAVSSYDRALALRPDDPDTLYNRGVALETLGDAQAALRSYEQALARRPDYAAGLSRQSALLESMGRLKEADAALDRLLAAAPADPDALAAKGNLFQRIGRFDDAVALYDRALAVRPDFFAAHANRATALKKAGRAEESLASVGKALALAPGDADMLILKGNVLGDLGRHEDADRAYRAAAAIRPVKVYPAAKARPHFRALLLFSPTCSNTPYEDLIGNAPFESGVLMLLPDMTYDMARLEIRADILVNLVSDADRGDAVLREAEEFLSRFGRPVVNPPHLVRGTERLSIARRLADVPHAVVPRMARCAGAEAGTAGADLGYPLVARTVGTHGGDAMELCAGPDALRDFAARHRGGDLYLSEFVDYRSPDGFFRKYRFMFVGREILPYHLAIGGNWKVHHATTGMAGCPWMQAEEAAFLREPAKVFGPEAFQALRTISERIGLDYFGIDCGLAADGRLIVFEANPSMLVHMHNAEFPYKDEYVLRIRDAFARMLAEKAGIVA